MALYWTQVNRRRRGTTQGKISAPVTLNSISFTAGSGGNPATVTVNVSYAGSNTLKFYFVSSTSTAGIDDSDRAAMKAGSGVTVTAGSVQEYGSVTIQDGVAVDVTGLTSASDTSNEIYGYVEEDIVGGQQSSVASDTTSVVYDFTPITLDGANCTPADNATTVADLTSDLIAAWSGGNAYEGTGNIEMIRASDDMVISTVAASACTGWGTASISIPFADRVEGVAYYVNADAGFALDEAGNTTDAITSKTAWNFTAAVVTVLDDFNRADEALETSANWGLTGGSKGNEVDANQLKSITATGGYRPYAWQTSFAANQFAECTVTNINGNSRYLYLHLRGNAADAQDLYSVEFIFNSTTYDIRVNWFDSLLTKTEIASSLGITNPSAPFDVRFEANGTTLRVLVAGVEMINATDGNITGAGYTGIQLYSAVAADLVVDDFNAGAL